MSAIGQEMRSAMRRVARRPGFAITSGLSFALALATSGTMYAVLDSLMHPAPAVTGASELYSVAFTDQRQHGLLVAPEFLHRMLSGLGTIRGVELEAWEAPRMLQTASEQRAAVLAHVGPSYFTMFGVRPLAGRFFLADDSLRVESNAIVISEGLWQRECADRGTQVNCTLRLDDTPFRVIGVAPAAFAATVYAEAWVLRRPGTPLDSTRSIQAYVRVRPGVSEQQLRSDLRTMGVRLAEQADAIRPTLRGPAVPLVIPLGSARRGVAPPQALLTFAAALIVLLACCNLAGMSIVRAMRRQGELALRATLGAGRLELVWTLVADWLVVLSVSCAAAYGLTVIAITTIGHRMPPALYIVLRQPRLNARVFAFEALLAVVGVLLIGAVPAILQSRVELVRSLRALAATVVGGRNRWYAAFIVLEIGMSASLIVATSLVLESVSQLEDGRGLVDGEGLYRTTLNQYGMTSRPPMGRPEEPDAKARQAAEQAYATDLNADDAMLRAAGSIPMARSAGLMLSTHIPRERVVIDEREVTLPTYALVSTRLPATLRLQILAGRMFVAADASNGTLGIVDDVLAKRLVGGSPIVGRRIHLDGPDRSSTQLTIIGVVKSFSLSPNSPRSQNMGSLMVLSSEAAAPGTLLFLRSIPGDATPAIVRTLRGAAPGARFAPIRRVADDLEMFRTRQAFVGWILAAFAVFGLALTGIGLFGVVSNGLVERRRELALRRALGASASEVIGQMLRQAGLVVCAGMLVGFFISLLVVHSMRASLYGLQATDPMVYATAVTCVAGAVILACIHPVMRAIRIDPLVVLRD